MPAYRSQDIQTVVIDSTGSGELDVITADTSALGQKKYVRVVGCVMTQEPAGTLQWLSKADGGATTPLSGPMTVAGITLEPFRLSGDTVDYYVSLKGQGLTIKKDAASQLSGTLYLIYQ